MTQFLDSLDERIVDILENGRGQTAMGQDAADRFFPANRLRRSQHAIPLRDPGYPAEAFDRTYELDYSGTSDDEAENPQDGTSLEYVRLLLVVGFVYGPELAPYVYLAMDSGEVASVAVEYVKRRALSEEREIRRALCFPGIFQDSDDTIPIVDMLRVGETTVDDLGGGRLVVTTPLRATLSVTNATRNNP